MRDIYQVLRKKQVEQEQLARQIEALQAAAEHLRSVAHLLEDGGAPPAIGLQSQREAPALECPGPVAVVAPTPRLLEKRLH